MPSPRAIGRFGSGEFGGSEAKTAKTGLMVLISALLLSSRNIVAPDAAIDCSAASSISPPSPAISLMSMNGPIFGKIGWVSGMSFWVFPSASSNWP